MAYFLVSVSNRTNLELCLKHSLAGFTSSINGVWTFLEIQEGDFISFLYGARVFNLYRVASKKAIKNAEAIPPWPSVTFSMSGKTYYFPFRLELDPIRELREPLVRAEFAYVAENLLLRGGYRKTHFQADQTTLQAVSQMGELYSRPVERLVLNNCETFIPLFTLDRRTTSPPEVFPFSELILQTIVRRYLASPRNLSKVLTLMGLSHLDASKFEVLGEKAFPEGHVDILAKEATPFGLASRIVIEIKLSSARVPDVAQINGYVQELGKECVGAVLIARDFPTGVLRRAQEEKVQTLTYSIGPFADSEHFSFEEAQDTFSVKEVAAR